jgi:hypothetical protein
MSTSIYEYKLKAFLQEQLESPLVLPVVLRYNPKEPETFGFVFPLAQLTWTLSFEYLAAALESEQGDRQYGDVLMWPEDHIRVHIRLRSPTGQAILTLNYGQVQEFVDSVHRMQAETIAAATDWDAELRRLVEGH